MSHRFGPTSTPLWHFSANGEPAGFKLLIRVVSVNDDGKLTLPIRELWAKIEGEAADRELKFLLNSCSSEDDDQEEEIHTIAKAHEAMGAGGPWLRSLEPSFPSTGRWYVTELVKTEPCIWENVECDAYGTHYKIHEKNLLIWLASGKDGKEVFDSEEDWACLSCPSDDESQEPSSGDGSDVDDDQDPEEFDQDDQPPDEDDGEQPSEPAEEDKTSARADDGEYSKQVDNVQILGDDDLNDDTEDGGVRLSPDQMKPARRFNFTLVGCEAEATDAAYDGDT